MDIFINNVVCSFSVRCHLNLKEIALYGSNVEYRYRNVGSVADPHHFNADLNPNLIPDPAVYLNADPDPAPLQFKVMEICDHWSEAPPRLHC